jgi:TonB family protein
MFHAKYASLFVLLLSGTFSYAQAAPIRVDSLSTVDRVNPKWDGAYEGTVRIDVTVGENGSVRDTKVLDGDPKLAKWAADAVKKWHFAPAIVDGKPFVAIATVTVAFRRPVPEALQPVCSEMGEEHLQTDSSGKKFICIDAGKARSHAVKMTAPAFPSVDKYEHISGDVMIRLRIAEDGSVSSVEAISGRPEFRNAALAAVRQWRYRPFLVNWLPVAAWVVIKINFSPN